MKKKDPIRKSRKTIGQYLRNARLTAGLTRKRVEASVGITLRELSNYENGVAGTPFDRFARLVSFYEVDYREAQIVIDKATEQLKFR
jgi:transcriptional regulator with XRE-family HTH domain